jgi:hypothetical protein
MQPYVACLKKNGVDLPANGRIFGNRNRQGGPGGEGQAGGQTPPSLALGGAPQTSVQGQTPAQGNGNGNGGAPPSFDRQKFQAAQQACASLLPEGVQPFGGFGGGGGANASAFNAYRSCMSDHGVTLPNRQNGQNGEASNGSSAPVSIDRNSDTFKAANNVCQALLPNGGQGFGGGPGGAPQGNGTPQGSAPTTSS